MKRAVLALLLTASLAWAADPIVKLPSEVKGDPGDFITVKADTEGKVVRWYALDKELRLFPAELLKDTKTAVVIGKSPGRWKLIAWTAAGDVPSEAAVCVVVVGDPGPPPPPVPPLPPVPPVPPIPPPPIPVEGFRVLMTFESGDSSKMPPAQQNVLYSKTIRDYLNSKCAVGPDGKTREWRIWDADVDTSAAGKVWQDAMKAIQGTTPGIVISTGKAGFTGPLPANVDEAMKLLKRFFEP